MRYTQGDLFRQLRDALPNDISDEEVIRLAEWTDPDDIIEQLEQLWLFEGMIEDPDSLTNEEIEELLDLEGVLRDE